MRSRKLGGVPLAIVCGFAALHLSCNDTAHQRQAIITATQQLRRDYNDGDCGRIYDKADLSFREAEPRDRWLAECSGIRRDFGQWHDFIPETNNAWPIGRGVLWVEGRSQFDGGTFRVRSDWNGADEPRLFNIQIETQGKTISIPGFGPGRPVAR